MCVCVSLAGGGSSGLDGGSGQSEGAYAPFLSSALLLQTRSSRHTQGAQPGLADQAAKLSYASAESLETMSETELPLGFSRMNRFRQSLPLSRSASQTKLRSPGTACPVHLPPGCWLLPLLCLPGTLFIPFTIPSLFSHLSTKRHPPFPISPPHPPAASSPQGLSLLSISSQPFPSSLSPFSLPQHPLT